MRIKYSFIGILLFISVQYAFGGDARLVEADSLFKSQKYTEAFSMYEQIMDQGYVAPSMLLKMAFIQDASGNYSNALYYLDMYYQKSADRQVVGKIEELATEHELSGYQYDDSHFFLALYSKYKTYIVMLFLFISLLLMAYTLLKTRRGLIPVVPGILQGLTLVLLLFIVNYTSPIRGVLTSDQTLLRSGASAGAEPVELVSKGHKVKVIERSDVWTKIQWDGQVAFVRNNRIKII